MGTECPHFDYCVVKTMDLRCKTPAHENCEIVKYYNKYGSDPLGVGAPMIDPTGLMRKIDEKS